MAIRSIASLVVEIQEGRKEEKYTNINSKDNNAESSNNNKKRDKNNKHHEEYSYSQRSVTRMAIVSLIAIRIVVRTQITAREQS